MSKVKSKIQSIIFKKSKGWTENKAKIWLQKNGYKHGKIDITKNYFRFRQVEPVKGAKYGTLKFGKNTGIKAVRIKNPKRTPTQRRIAVSKGMHKSAEQLRKDFTGQENIRTNHRTLNIPSKMVFIGGVPRIDYDSNKFDGNMRSYFHNLKKHGVMLISPSGNLIIITDLKLKITKRGLIG